MICVLYALVCEISFLYISKFLQSNGMFHGNQVETHVRVEDRLQLALFLANKQYLGRNRFFAHTVSLGSHRNNGWWFCVACCFFSCGTDNWVMFSGGMLSTTIS